MVFLSISSSIMAGKIISVFGFDVSAATCLYASIFLATDVIADVYGKKNALYTVLYAFLANVVFLIFGTLVVKLTSSVDSPIVTALDSIFDFLPRLLLGGLIAFLVAQTLDVYIFHKIKEKTNGKHLWLRNNVSTALSQLVDTTIVWFVAFYGLVENIWAIILASYLIKVITALIDTPFVYFSRSITPEVRSKND